MSLNMKVMDVPSEEIKVHQLGSETNKNLERSIPLWTALAGVAELSLPVATLCRRLCT